MFVIGEEQFPDTFVVLCHSTWRCLLFIDVYPHSAIGLEITFPGHIYYFLNKLFLHFFLRPNHTRPRTALPSCRAQYTVGHNGVF